MTPDDYVSEENIALRQFEVLSSRFVQLDHLYVRLPNGQVTAVQKDRKYMLNAIDIDFNDQDTKYYADENTINLSVIPLPLDLIVPRGPTTRNVFSVGNIYSRLGTGIATTVTQTPPTETTSGITQIDINYDSQDNATNGTITVYGNKLTVNNIKSRLAYNNGITLSNVLGTITQIGIAYDETLTSTPQQLKVYDIHSRLSKNNGVTLTVDENKVTQVGIHHDTTLSSNVDGIGVYNIYPRLSYANGIKLIESTTNDGITQIGINHNDTLSSSADGIGVLNIRSRMTPNNGIKLTVNDDITLVGIEHDETLTDDGTTLSVYNIKSRLSAGNNGVKIEQGTNGITKITPQFTGSAGIALSSDKKTFYLTASYLTGGQNNTNSYQFTVDDKTIKSNLINVSQLINDAHYITDDEFLDNASYVTGHTYSGKTYEYIASRDDYYLNGVVKSAYKLPTAAKPESVDVAERYLKLVFVKLTLSGTSQDDIQRVLTDPVYIDITELFKGFKEGRNISLSGNIVTNLLSGDRTWISVNDIDHSINWDGTEGRFISFSGNQINNTIDGGRLIRVNDDGTIDFTGTDGSAVSTVPYLPGFGLALSATEFDKTFYLTGTVLSGGTNIEVTPDNYINCLLSGDQRYIVIDNNRHTVNWILSSGTHINFDDNKINTDLHDGNLIKVNEDGSIDFIGTDGSSVSSLPYTAGFGLALSSNDDLQQFRLTGTVLSGGTNIEVTEDNYINNLLSGGKYIEVNNNTHLINFTLSAGRHINFDNNKINNGLYDGHLIHIDENGTINYTGQDGADVPRYTAGSGLALSGTEFRLTGTVLRDGRFILITDNYIVNDYIALSAGKNVLISSMYKTVDTGEVDLHNLPITKQVLIGYFVLNLLSSGTYINVDNEDHSVNFTLSNGQWIDFNNGKINSFLQDGTLIHISEDGKINFTGQDGTEVPRYTAGFGLALSSNEFYLTGTVLSGGTNILVTPDNYINNLLSNGTYINVNDEDHSINFTLSAGRHINFNNNKINTDLHDGNLIQVSEDGSINFMGQDGTEVPRYTAGFGLALSSNLFYLTGTVLSGDDYLTYIDNNLIKIKGGNIGQVIMSVPNGGGNEPKAEWRDPRKYIGEQVGSGVIRVTDLTPFPDSLNQLTDYPNGLYSQISIAPGKDNQVLKTLCGTVLWANENTYYPGTNILITSANVINGLLSSGTYINVDSDTHTINFALSSGTHINFNNGKINTDLHNGHLIRVNSDGSIDYTGTTGDDVDPYTAGFGLALSSNLFYLTGTVLSGGRFIEITNDHIVNDTIVLSGGTNTLVSSLYKTVDTGDVDDQNQPITKQVLIGYYISNLLSGGRLTTIDNTTHLINNDLSGLGFIFVNDVLNKVSTNLHAGSGIYINPDTGEIRCTVKPSEFVTPILSGRFIEISGELNTINWTLSTQYPLYIDEENKLIAISSASDDVIKVLKSVSGNIDWYDENSYTAGDHIEITSTNVINCLLSGDGTITLILGLYIKIKPHTDSTVDYVLRSYNGGVRWDKEIEYTDGRFIEIGLQDSQNRYPINCTLSGLDQLLNTPGYITSASIPGATPVNGGRYINVVGPLNSINWTLSALYPIYIDDENNVIALSSALDNVTKVLKSVSGNIDWYNENAYYAGEHILITSTNVINCLLSGDGLITDIVGEKIIIKPADPTLNLVLRSHNGGVYWGADEEGVDTTYTSGRFIRIGETKVGNSYPINSILSAQYPLQIDEDTAIISISAAGDNLIKILKSVSGVVSWEDNTTTLSSGRYININDNKIDFVLSNGQWINFDGNKINSFLTGGTGIEIASDGHINFTGIKGGDFDTTYSDGRFISISGDNNSINVTLSAGRYMEIENNFINNILSGNEKTIHIDGNGVILVQKGNVGQILSTTATGAQWVNNPGYITVVDLPPGTVYATGFGLAASGDSKNVFYLTGTVLSSGRYNVIENNEINSTLSGDENITTITQNGVIKIIADSKNNDKVLKTIDGVVGWYDDLTGDDNTNTLYTDGRFIEIGSAMVGGKWPINSTLSGSDFITINENTGVISITPGPEDEIKVLKSVSGTLSWLDNTTVLSSGRYIEIKDNKIDFVLSAGKYINFDDNKINCELTGLDQLENTPRFITLDQVPPGSVYGVDFGLAASGLNNNIFYLTGTVLSGGTNIGIENNLINNLLSGGKHIKVNNDTHLIDFTLSAGKWINFDDEKINCLLTGLDQLLNTPRFITLDQVPPGSVYGVSFGLAASGENDNIFYLTGTVLSGGTNVEIKDNYINCLLSGDNRIVRIKDHVILLIPSSANETKVLKSVSGTIYWLDLDTNLSSGRYININLNGLIDFVLSAGTNINFNDNKINCELTGLNQLDNSITKYIRLDQVPSGTVYGAGFGLALSSSEFYLTGTILSGGTNIEIKDNLINNLLSGDLRHITVNNTAHRIEWNLSAGKFINFDDNKINCLLTGLDQLENTPGYITIAQVPPGSVYSTGFGLAASGEGSNIFYLTGTVLSGGRFIDINDNNIDWTLSADNKHIFIDLSKLIISTNLHGDDETIRILDDGTISCLVSSIPPITYTGIAPIVVNPDTHEISFNGKNTDTLYFGDGETICGYIDDNVNKFKVYDIYSRLSAGTGIALEHDDEGITTICCTLDTKDSLYAGNNITLCTHYVTVNDQPIANGILIHNLLSDGRFTTVDNTTHKINSTLSGDTTNFIDIVGNKIKIVKGQLGYILWSTANGLKWDGPPSGDAPITYNYFTSSYLNGYGLGLTADAANDNWFFLTATYLTGGQWMKIDDKTIDCVLSGDEDTITIDSKGIIKAKNLSSLFELGDGIEFEKSGNKTIINNTEPNWKNVIITNSVTAEYNHRYIVKDFLGDVYVTLPQNPKQNDRVSVFVDYVREDGIVYIQNQYNTMTFGGGTFSVGLGFEIDRNFCYVELVFLGTTWQLNLISVLNDDQYYPGYGIDISEESQIHFALSAGQWINYDHDKVNCFLTGGTNILIDDDGTINFTGTIPENTDHQYTDGRFIEIAPSTNQGLFPINWTLSAGRFIEIDDELNLINNSMYLYSGTNILVSAHYSTVNNLRVEDGYLINSLLSGGNLITVNNTTHLIDFDLTSGQWINFEGNKINCFLTGGNNIEIGSDGKINFTGNIPTNTDHQYTDGRFIDVAPSTNQGVFPINFTLSAGRFILLDDENNLINNTIQMYSGVNTLVSAHYTTVDNEQVQDGYLVNSLLSGGKLITVNNTTHLIDFDLTSGQWIDFENGKINCFLTGSEYITITEKGEIKFTGNPENTDTKYTGGRFTRLAPCTTFGYPIDWTLSAGRFIELDDEENIINNTMYLYSGTNTLVSSHYATIDGEQVLDGYLIVNLLSGGKLITVNNTTHLIDFDLTSGQWINFNGNKINCFLTGGTNIEITDKGVINFTGTIPVNTDHTYTHGRFIRILPSTAQGYPIDWTLSAGRYIELDDENNLINNTMLLHQGTNVVVSTQYKVVDNLRVPVGYFISNLLSGGDLITVNNNTHLIDFDLTSGQWINFDGGKINCFLTGGTNIEIEEDGTINFTGTMPVNTDTKYTDGRFIKIAPSTAQGLFPIDWTLSGGRFILLDDKNNLINNTMQMYSGRNINVSAHYITIDNEQVQDGYLVNCLLSAGEHIRINDDGINCTLSGDGSITTILSDQIKIIPGTNGYVLKTVNGRVQWDKGGSNTDNDHQYKDGRYIEIAPSTNQGLFPINWTLSAGRYIEFDNENNINNTMKLYSGRNILVSAHYSTVNNLRVEDGYEVNNLLKSSLLVKIDNTTHKVEFALTSGQWINFDNGKINCFLTGGTNIKIENDGTINFTGTIPDEGNTYTDGRFIKIGLQDNQDRYPIDFTLSAGKFILFDAANKLINNTTKFYPSNHIGISAHYTTVDNQQVQDGYGVYDLLSGDNNITTIENNVIKLIPGANNKILRSNGTNVFWGDDATGGTPGTGSTYYADNLSLTGYTENSQNKFKIRSIFSVISAGPGVNIWEEPNTLKTIISAGGGSEDINVDNVTLTGYNTTIGGATKTTYKAWNLYSRLKAGPNIHLIQDAQNGITTISAAGGSSGGSSGGGGSTISNWYAYMRASNSSTGITTTNETSDPYLNLIENGTWRSGVQLKGAGGINITSKKVGSDANKSEVTISASIPSMPNIPTPPTNSGLVILAFDPDLNGGTYRWIPTTPCP